MNDILTYPVEGINQLIIETLASDAVMRGAPGATAIQITFVSPERTGGPEFIPEDQAVRFVHAIAERVLVPDGLAVIVQEALGDLRIQGLAGHVSMEAVRGDLRLEALAGQVVMAQADADIRAERVANLRILGRCRGDLRFLDGGQLFADEVDGDLRLNNVISAKLGRLLGDLWADKLSGALEVTQAQGDARLNDIGGPVTIGALSGDLRGLSLAGGLNASQVKGDASLSGPLIPPNEYIIVADGDIYLNLPADTDAQLSVLANGRIRSDVSLTPASDGAPVFSATLGQGAGRISVTSHGDLRIGREGGAKAGRWEKRGRRSDDSFAELNNLGDRIRQQVAASLASAGINLETGETNLGWKRGRGGHGATPFPPPTPPAPPERPKPPAPPRAAGEEQLTILKMVEEGRITPEEADKLLKALGI